MHCLTVIYPYPDDEAAFKSYYEDKHVPLAAKLPGLVKHHFVYPEAIGPGDVFCIFQVWFEDSAAMGAAMQSEVGQQVAADVPNYSPKGHRSCISQWGLRGWIALILPNSGMPLRGFLLVSRLSRRLMALATRSE